MFTLVYHHRGHGLRARARATVRVHVCFLSPEWTDLVFPRESSFTSLRKKRRDGWGKGREEEMMELEVGGGVLSESVSPSLTPYPARNSAEVKLECSR